MLSSPVVRSSPRERRGMLGGLLERRDGVLQEADRAGTRGWAAV
jgi:hypothetical protein